MSRFLVLKLLLRALLLTAILLLAGCVAVPSAGAPPRQEGPAPLPPLPPLAPDLAPSLYAGLGVADLAARTYGAGDLRIEEPLGTTEYFTRTLVSWQSDGLTVYGFMDVPQGEGPFPVVIVIHGYVDPAIYSTLTYTTRYADALAAAGYLVIHPNLRGYPPSQDGPNRLRVGFAVDILDLIADIQQQAGQPGALEQANAMRIGLWGHSMGGGITQRVLVVDGLRGGPVRAALLYGSMSGDETRNHERILNVFSGGTRGSWDVGEEPTPEELLRIDPARHLDAVAAAVSIHHGAADDEVPPAWSDELCAMLQEAGKAVECYGYEGQPHIFNGEADALFMQRAVDFFDRNLKD